MVPNASHQLQELQIGGSAHVFNEMKPNSGDAAAEPDRFPVKKSVPAIISP
jgi:hypothetical protein